MVLSNPVKVHVKRAYEETTCTVTQLTKSARPCVETSVFKITIYNANIDYLYCDIYVTDVETNKRVYEGSIQIAGYSTEDITVKIHFTEDLLGKRELKLEVWGEVYVWPTSMRWKLHEDTYYIEVKPSDLSVTVDNVSACIKCSQEVEVNTGQKVVIDFTIKLSEPVPCDSYVNARLIINNSVVKTKKVEVPVNSSTVKDNFEHTFTSVGDYTVYVDVDDYTIPK